MGIWVELVTGDFKYWSDADGWHLDEHFEDEDDPDFMDYHDDNEIVISPYDERIPESMISRIADQSQEDFNPVEWPDEPDRFAYDDPVVIPDDPEPEWRKFGEVLPSFDYSSPHILCTVVVRPDGGLVPFWGWDRLGYHRRDDGTLTIFRGRRLLAIFGPDDWAWVGSLDAGEEPFLNKAASE